MIIKDINIGDVVYIVSLYQRTGAISVEKASVTYVGRKYVKVGCVEYMQAKDYTKPYLVEKHFYNSEHFSKMKRVQFMLFTDRNQANTIISEFQKYGTIDGEYFYQTLSEHLKNSKQVVNKIYLFADTIGYVGVINKEDAILTYGQCKYDGGYQSSDNTEHVWVLE